MINIIAYQADPTGAGKSHILVYRARAIILREHSHDYKYILCGDADNVNYSLPCLRRKCSHPSSSCSADILSNILDSLFTNKNIQRSVTYMHGHIICQQRRGSGRPLTRSFSRNSAPCISSLQGS